MKSEKHTLASHDSSSVSDTGPWVGDDGGEGNGVLASFSNESYLFFCLLRAEAGDGGGLGGRCSICCCSCEVASAMICSRKLVYDRLKGANG